MAVWTLNIIEIVMIAFQSSSSSQDILCYFILLNLSENIYEGEN